MSSISAMGPRFFHWKSKLWLRGGRSRLALSENIENDFVSAVCDRFMPSTRTKLRDPYKIRFGIFLKIKMFLILWYGVAESSFCSKMLSFIICSTRCFDVYFVGVMFVFSESSPDSHRNLIPLT